MRTLTTLSDLVSETSLSDSGAVNVEDSMISFARLALAGVRAAKLGYAIGADHWGHGYGTDAARTLTDFAFTTLQLHRVSAATAPDNMASMALLKRLGFVYEGRGQPPTGNDPRSMYPRHTLPDTCL